MAEFLRWLLAVELIALLTIPIAWRALPNLRDGGAGLALPLGLLLLGFPVWLLSHTNLLPVTPVSFWVAMLVLGAVSLRLMWPRRRQFLRHLRRERTALLTGQALFLVFFVGWALARAHYPHISGTEQPMDLLMLNAVTEAGHAPPEDPWLAGHPVAYYYFGYWMHGMVGLLSGVPTYIGYNLSLALVAGAAAWAVFSLSYGLISPGRKLRRSVIPAALLSVMLLLVSSNYAGLWELGAARGVGPDALYEWVAIENVEAGAEANSWRPDRFSWWFQSSRVINTFVDGVGQDFTIQEFPAFSLTLGDLHPHLMSIPFMLLFSGMALNLLLDPLPAGPARLLERPGRWAMLALATGSLGFINAWDLAFAALALAALVTVRAYGDNGGRLWPGVGRGAATAALVVIPGMFLFAPFYFGTFSSQVQWDKPIGAAPYPTRPVHMLTVWGAFVALIAPMAISVAAPTVRAVAVRTRRWLGSLISDDNVETAEDSGPFPGMPDAGPRWLAVAALVVPYFLWAGIHLAVNEGAAPGDLWHRLLAVLPLAAAAWLTLVGAFRLAREGRSAQLVFAATLLGLSLYLLYGVELLFVHDLFGTRMNTVFKTYYQVWIFGAPLAAYAAYYWSSRHRSWTGAPALASKTAAVIAGVLALGSLYYLPAALDTRTGGFQGELSLNGIAAIGESHPGELSGILWLRRNAGPEARLVEAVGDSYSEYGRVAATTGIPTVLGWPWHEQQWRGNDELFLDREDDVRRIYETGDDAELASLLRKYRIQYVIVSHRERASYRPVDETRFARIGELVFPEHPGDTDFLIYDVSATTGWPNQGE